MEFSIRQGDPAASVFFTIYIELLLVLLERRLHGLFMGLIREASIGYMDDINELGEDDNDIVLTDQICRAFEAVSGAILNRNRKTVVLGLGSWAGRQDWPLPWLQAVDQAKVLGVVVTPVFATSVSASWEMVASGVERVLLEWPLAACLPFARGPGPWRPLPSPRRGSWRRFCLCLLLLPTAFAGRCPISSGGAA